MFGKILRAGKGGHGLKYKIDVQVTQLENLPTSIKKCRVVWARSAKLQFTDVKDVRGSVASFKQTLTQVTTMYRDKSGKLEPKEYEFKVQVPGKSSSDSTVTIGKANLDMSKFCRDETTTQNSMLPITFKVGGTTTGYLKMAITTVFLGDSNEDGLTEVSGLTGLTSDHGSVREQDLDGFGDDDNSKFSKRAKGKRDDGAAAGSAAATSTSGRSVSKPESGRHRKPLPPMAEEDDSDLEDKELEASPPPAKSGKKKLQPARQPVAAEEEDANPFAKKVSKPALKKPPPKVWEDDEDVSPLNSDISDSEIPPPVPKGKKSKVPEESFDDMKSSLFAIKKAAGAADRAASGASASAASAAGSSSSRATGSKGTSKAPAPAPVGEEDEDSLRDDLFSSAKPKSTAVAGSKAGAGKAAAAASGAAAAGAAAAEISTAASKHRSKHAAPPPPPPEDYEDEEEDDYGPSTSAVLPPAGSSKSRGKAAETVEAPATKPAGTLGRAGSARPEKGGSTAELEDLRQRVAQLEKQLADEQVAKNDLSKKMQKYVDKVADLEDQLAEGDVTELYTQMREMEAKYQAEIKDMEAKYEAEIKELMDRHLAETAELEERHRTEVEELQLAAASNSGHAADAASAEELERLQSQLRDQEALLASRTAKMEAEQAAANAARQAAEAKLADANKMIDDSLLVATRHQQENKSLQEEIARLKRQLEDASAWDTSAAVAAVTAASNNGRRSSEDEDELEELREKLQELQEENARLQKLNEDTQQAAADMLNDVNAILRDKQGRESFTNNPDASYLGQLAVGLHCLCDAFTLKSADLKDMETRLEELSRQATSAVDSARTSAAGGPQPADGVTDGSVKVKPHELLSRVQQLTSEREALLEQLASCRQAQTELAAAQHMAASLQQQLDQLAAEKEAVERFKVATITDLRRQNDELRNSLRSLSSTNMSPRVTFDEDGIPSAQPSTPGEVRMTLAGASAALLAVEGGSGNWNEFESLVAQLKADRADLHRQVEQLKADKVSLGKQVEELRSTGGAAAAGSGEPRHSSSRRADRLRLEELEQERSQLKSEVTRLQAQLAELSEADTVIKEWSDYADGLVVEKTKLEEQVQELTQQIAAGTAATGLEVVAAEKRVADLRRALAEAEQKAETLARTAEELECRAASAESRLQELQRLLDDANAATQDEQWRVQESQLRLGDAERRTQDLELRSSASERRAEQAESSARDAVRRAEVAESSANDALRRAQVAESQAAEAERRAAQAAAEAAAATAASRRLQEESAAFTVASAATAAASPLWAAHQPQSQPADTSEVMELRHEISRLEASLSGLRLQLMEPQSQTASPEDDVASSSRTRHRDLTAGKETLPRARQWRDTDDEEEAASSVGSEEAPGLSAARARSERGWDTEVEELRARNASLETAVAGLQATIASLQEEQAASSSQSRGSRRAERQVQDLQTRLTAALQEKAELESTVVLLRSELERAPLVQARAPDSDATPSSRSDAGDDDVAVTRGVAPADAAASAALAEATETAAVLRRQVEALEEDVTQIRNDRAMLSATVSSLRLELEHLQEEKHDAERTISRLSAEMEELAEALDAANTENERLSLEVLSLRDQVEQLEGGGSNRGTNPSGTPRSSASGRHRSSQGTETDDSGPLPSAKSCAAAAEGELAAARAAARELILLLASGSPGGDGFDDAPAFGGPDEQEDLAQSLKALRGQIVELQNQSRQQRAGSGGGRTSSNAANAAAIAATEAQLAKANARIDELQQMLEDAEIENQHLTEQLEECLTGGRKGPDSVGSVAEECQSSYGGSAAGAATANSNPYSYGHANTLTLSAFEQRLAMAEGRRDELSAALEEAAATNRRLEADVASLQQQLAAVRRGQDPASLDDFERPISQVPARSRGSRPASDSEESYKKRIEELQAANRKLEAVCHDLEDKAQAAQEHAEQLQLDLENAKERVRTLEATTATLQKRLEEEATGGGRQGKEKLADLESRAARLAREKVALEKQLAEERTLRQELEDTLKDKLDRDGDDEAAETVAAFEVKYNRLKERYKMLEESSQEEIDELQDQLTETQGQVSDLQRQIKQLQSQLAQNRNGGGAFAAAAGGANAEELRNLRAENERLVQRLVAKTMELAELNESEITMKRELARLKEVNMKLAQKATTLEAEVAMAHSATKGGKK